VDTSQISNIYRSVVLF